MTPDCHDQPTLEPCAPGDCGPLIPVLARFARSGDAPVMQVRLARGQRLTPGQVGDGRLWEVTEGCIATCAATNDGRRQILWLTTTPEMLGVPDLSTPGFWAEALGPSRLCTTDIGRPAERAARDATFASLLLQAAEQRLRRVGRRLIGVGRLSGEERLTAFLADMAVRIGCPLPSGLIRVVLPMSREDIADYLGLNPETNLEAKTRIARALAELVPDGATLFIDGGTTCCVAARGLVARPSLKIVTCSTEIARLVAGVADPAQMQLAPGEMDSEDLCVYGGGTAEWLGRFRCNYAVLSASAVNADDGFLDFKPREAEVKRVMLRQAERVVVLADSTKFGRRGFARFAAPEEVDLLITEAQPTAILAARLAGADVAMQITDL